MRLNLSGFLNFSALNARRADANALGRTFDHCVYGLQIQIPAPLGDIVGVANAVSKPRAALTDFTHFRHKQGLLMDSYESSIGDPYLIGTGLNSPFLNSTSLTAP